MAAPIDTATGRQAGESFFEDDQPEAPRAADPLRGEDVKWLMAHAQGRRVMWRYLSTCGVFRETFSSDPLRMARGEGRRSVGLELMADIMAHSPASYSKMMEEASKADLD